LARFDVRRLASVQVDRCAPEAPELCIHAAMWFPGSNRYSQLGLALRIETDNRSTDMLAAPTIRGISYVFTHDET
jgi:hypothetical protein